MEMLPVVHPVTNELTGLVLPRQQVITQKLWCRSTNVFIVHPDGRLLCHKRSLEKERLPGTWCTHLGGHVGQGETYESNAQKEVEEEAGIRINSSQLIPWRTTKLEEPRLWVREFVTVLDRKAEDFTPQPGEVDEFRWLHPQEITQACSLSPNGWCAGTHDFNVEYECLRAVCTAAKSIGPFAHYTFPEVFAH